MRCTSKHGDWEDSFSVRSCQCHETAAAESTLELSYIKSVWKIWLEDQSELIKTHTWDAKLDQLVTLAPSDFTSSSSLLTIPAPTSSQILTMASSRKSCSELPITISTSRAIPFMTSNLISKPRDTRPHAFFDYQIAAAQDIRHDVHGCTDSSHLSSPCCSGLSLKNCNSRLYPSLNPILQIIR